MIVRDFRLTDKPAICEIYRIAFAGSPWFLNVTQEEAERRFADHQVKTGFTCLVAEDNGEVVGAAWFNTICKEELEVERGPELARFAEAKSSGIPWIWARETIITQSHQGKGIANRLKEQIISSIRERFGTALLLTRMRDDNLRIVAVNQRFGFLRTGINAVSQTLPGVVHEYWYRLIEPHET